MGQPFLLLHDLLFLIIILTFADLCGVEVARDVGVGDILPVDQFAQEEIVRVWKVPCLEYLGQYHADHTVPMDTCGYGVYGL